MRNLWTAAFAAAFCASATAQAASSGYDRCVAGIDRGALVKTQTLDCATQDMDRADGALNATYRALLPTLPKPRQNKLVQEERAWIERRRQRCHAAEADPIPSPEINRMLCLVRETDARTEALKAIR